MSLLAPLHRFWTIVGRLLTQTPAPSRGARPPAPVVRSPSEAAAMDALASLNPLLTMASDELSLACDQPVADLAVQHPAQDDRR